MRLSLFDLMSQGDKPEEAGTMLPDEPSPHTDHDDPQGFALVMRRRRKAALLQAMLKAQGYEDLARMAGIREQGGPNVY